MLPKSSQIYKPKGNDRSRLAMIDVATLHHLKLIYDIRMPNFVIYPACSVNTPPTAAYFGLHRF